MDHSSFLRRSKAGHSGSSAPALQSFGNRVVLLLLVGAASLLTLAGATLTSRGPFGHGHTSTRPLPSWPESNTVVAAQNKSIDRRASLTVRFHPGTSTAAQHRLLARFGAVQTDEVETLGLHVIAVDPAKAQALLESLRSAAAVSTATPDDVRQVAGDTSTDAIAGQWALGKIDAAAAQRSTTSKRTVTIAVLDTGVDATHPALEGHLVAGYSALRGSNASADPNGHGTWMASIALAADPAARVQPVQVLNAEGLGKDSDIIKGLVWAADHHANVIVMSFAGEGYSPALQRAIDYAWSKGSVVVAATGNRGSSKPTYPAGDAKVVGVSATDAHDRLWSGSNFGSDVTLAAPGVDVVAAAVGGGTTTITGTSASAALVAGAAALLLGADANATNATVVGRLARNAVQAGTVEQTGNGRLNLLQAVLDRGKAPLVTAGVQGRQTGGPFVGPYGVAGTATGPTVVGTGSSIANTNTIAVTLTAGVPVNSTLFIVAGQTVSSATAFTATDDLGTPNTYTQDISKNTTSATVSIIRAVVTHALATNNIVTITTPTVSTALKSATVFYYNGILTTGPLDVSTSAVGNSAAATATTATTTAAAEVVVAGIGTNKSFLTASACTPQTAAGTANTFMTEPMTNAVSATGAQTCATSLTATGRWAEAIATYKIDVTNPTAAVTFPTAAAYNAAGWAAVTGSGTDESGGSGIDTTAGKTQLSIHDDTSNQYWSGAAWGGVGGAEAYINPTTGPTVVTPGTAATWSYTFANTNLTNTHAYTVHTKTIDLAGNTSTVASATTAYDTSAPNTATLTTNSSYNAAGWSGHVDGTTTDSGTGSNGISAVNVSIADSVSGKCWNGANFTTATCPSWNAVSSGGTATGAANASWQYNLASSALTDGHTYTVSVQATDATATGTTSGTLAAGTFKYDTTAPAFGTLSYVLSGNCNADLFASGATMYYNPSAAACANAFNSRAVVTDATSGPASVNFPAIATGSFAHTNETTSGVSPYTSALNYGWSSTGATFSSTSTLTATDAAGNTSTANITITKDATAPASGVISVPATVTTLSVPITTTPATDGGSGLAAGTNAITRSNGQAVAANACPGSGYSGATTVTSPDTSVASGQCYVYTLTATDNVGNTATWTSSPVLVDTVAPTDAITLSSATGAYKSGATIYYKGNAAGSFKLRDTVTDALSGPASATFGLLSGGAGFAAHGSETINSPAGGPYDSTAITWAGAASGAPTIPVNSTDVATNNSGATTLTLTLDNTAPGGGVISVPAKVNTLSVPITTTNATDGGSGLAAGTNTITRSNGQAVAANACPGSGYSGSNAIAASPDTSVTSGQCYVYTLTATDNVGNTATWTSSPVMVDTVAPTDAFTLTSATGAYKSGATIYYKGNAAGSFKLRDSVSDALSGPASATFGLLTGLTGATHSAETVSTPAGGPYDSTAISWATATGAGSLAAHGTDAAGNNQSDTTFTLTLDNTAPSGGVISVPATVNALSVAITTTPATDGGSGLAAGTNAITRSNGQAVAANACPGSGYSGATTVTSPDTGVASGQCYVYTLTATDNVGNTATWTSSPVLVDTVAPTDAFTLTAVSGGVYKSAATIYYKGNAAASFKLRDTVTDGVSGPASTTFGLLTGLTGATHSAEAVSTPAGGPYDSTAISWATASGTGSVAAHGTDVAGNNQSDTTFTLTLDNGAPTSGSISVPAYATSTSVTITSGNYSDAGSGIASNVITRSAGQSPTAGVCPGSGYSGATVVSSPDTGVTNGQCYVYTLTGTDNVGNTATVASSPVLIDTTAPADAFTLTAVSGGVYKSGATIYYKGNAAGSFKLRDTVTDAGSGPASTTFGLLTGLTGATHSSETVSTPAGGPYDSTAISWATASGTGSLTAHGTDVAGNSQSDTTFTLTLDNGTPTGGSISIPAYATSTSVTITSGNYSDGGSGIATNVITRSGGQSPIGGVCPAVGTFTGSTVVSSPDTGVTNGQCYVYTLTGTDNVGNSSSLATTNAVLVDTGAPSDAITLTAATGAFKSGATIYYKGNAAGSFKLRDTVTDGVSGPASATFGLLSGGAGFAAHSSETISGSSPYDSTAITWAGAASGSPTVPVHSADAAGNTSSNTTLTLSLDNTAPSGGSISVPAYATSTSITITSGNYSDGGSGLTGGSNTITRSNGQSPTAGVCPASGYTGAATVSSPDTGVSDGQCYVYTLTATDNVGNTSTVSSSPVLVDTTAPADAFTLTGVSGGVYKSGATIYYKGNAAGSFKLRDAVTDAGSGPASTTFGLLSGLTGASHASETVGGSSPYDSTAISWASASGTGSLAAHGTDAAGNSATDTTFTLSLDNTAPSGGSISVPAYATSTSVTITSGNYSDGGSGLTGGSNTITRSNGQSPTAGVCPASGYTGAATVSSPDTGVSDGQCYVYTLTATDNVGNTSTVSSSPVLVDATAPAYTSSALDAGGTHVDLTFAETASGLDSGSTTPTSAFTVTGATVSGVSYTDATHIRLTLASRLYGDAAPTVAYNPGALTTGQKVKDGAGNLLGSVSAQSISMSAVASLSQSTVTASPGSITANGASTSTVTVQLKNAAGTNLSTSGGTVSLAVGAGSLGAVTNHNDGTYTATLTASTVAQNVSVTGQLDGSAFNGSASVTYAPGAAAKLAFGIQPPASTSAGQTLSPSVTVRILDANDNLVTGSSASVTVALGSNPGSATLSGTKTRNASAGVATFDDLSLNKTGAGYTLAATSGSLTGATSSTYDITPASATTIAVNDGDAQTATVGTNVATAPSVIVTDQFGNPVPGTSVTFAIGLGSGSLTGGSATTDASGVATVGSWQLGATVGVNTLTATAAGLTGSPVTFGAIGLAAATTIALDGGDGQSATVDTNVATAPSVLVTNTLGLPIAGIAVTFAVASGGGSATGTNATTNASGIATVGSWKLGTTAGTNTLTATSGGLAGSPITFTATGVAGTAGSMVVNAGDGQSATVNTNVATAPSVLVTDTHGNPVSGASVTFAIGSGGGSVTGGSATTNASGIATVGSWTLGTGVGANQLTVSSAGIASVTFNATGTAAAAANIAVHAGDNQSVTVNTNVTAPSVRVTDTYGNPISGVSVTFAVAAGGGSATGLSQTTNGSGIATVGSWTLGSTTGANTLTAISGSLTGSPVTFNATGTADVLDHLVLSPASASVSADVGSQTYTAEGRDQYGNTLGDATGSTVFTVTGGSCTGAACTVTTVGSHTVTGTLLGATGNATLIITAGAAANIALQTGNAQSATVNSSVATAPSVLVTDAHGNPVSATAVTFAVASGGGSVTGGGATTNAGGIATVGSWTLGTTAGANSLTATASGLAGSPVTFTATGTAGAASSIAVNAGDGQSATVNQSVAAPPAVKVTDALGNAVSGISVTFAVGSGGGSATGLNAMTNGSGVATVGSWTLGTTAGANTLTATSGSLTGSPVTFNATGVHDAATTIAVNGGNGQSATVNTNVATSPSVKVTDSFGNTVSGTSVTFAIGSGGGSATGLSTTTNGSGVATVGSWTLGTTAGANTLTATSGSLTGSPVTFTATGTAAAAATIAVNNGDGQSATVDQSVASAPSVKVTDAFGNAVSGVSVTFAVASGGGSATGLSTTTNGSGVATVGSWTLGTTAGANTLTATSGSLTGSPVTFNATGVHDAAATIAVNGGNNQSATVNTNVATAPSVVVDDQFGNPVPGLSVIFAIGSGGGSLSGGSATTGASGVATVGSWTLGTAAGANTLTATSGSLTGSPVSFTATGVHDAATTIAVNGGNNQSTTVNTNVATAPSVVVGDQYGNPVSGVGVTFAVASGGGSGTGLSATTNGSGVATVGSWKLGTAAGANTLSATASVGSATFTATGTAGAASSIAVGAGDGQVAVVNTNVTTAPSAFVADSFGNPVVGVAVTFAVASGGGSATALSATTNAGGLATVGSWKLGTATGANTLTATTSVGSVTFNATGVNDAAATIAINAGNNQSVTVNTTVGTAPSVLVTDQYGNPVAGVSVMFAVASGGGSGTSLSQTTGADGVAHIGSWKLGTAVGVNTLTAASAGLTGSPITFSATGTAAAAGTVAINSGNSQSTTVDTNVSTVPSVVVNDSYGNPVAGASVTFAIGSGGGSLTGGNATTDASGVAAVGSWKLGTTAGANTLTATSGSLTGSPVTFTATGVAGAAGSMTINGGEGQSATVNTNVATPPSVLVTDAHANPVAGVAVTFSIGSGGGSLTGGSATTDANGIATVGSWQLGTSAGADTLSVSSTGLSSITFNATGVAGAAAWIALAGGDNQTATVDTNVATAPSVSIADQYGNPVAGVPVTFAIGSGGGSLTGANATSAANGIATVGSWKLGAAAGAKTLTASSTGLAGSPITFNATAVPDTAGSMTINSGDGQSAIVNTNVATAPSVLVTDVHGNPISGVAVTFAIGSGGGSLTGGSATTNASGIATVGSWKLGTTAAANTLTVSSTGLSSVTFNATGTAAAAATIAVNAGNNQNATVHTNVAVAPSVKVTDTYGNSVSGVAVTFAVASGGGSATAVNGTTNASGVAAVGSWKLGTSAGANTLTATSTGLAGSPLTFNATGTPDSATTLAMNGGDNQNATVDTNVATAPSVKATDQFGNGIPGVSVTFLVASGGGSATGTSATTDAAGVATVGSWKVGTTAGLNTLTVSSTGLTGSPVTLNATGTAGAASALAANSGDGQSATVNANVASAPSVKVTDSFGNPVSGIFVTFAVASGGGSATGTSTTTNASGVATVGSWKLGTAAGANTLTATSGGLTGSPVTFTATGTADSAASLVIDAGDNQSATVNTNVATAPSLKVTDQYGNAVSGVGVTFAVASGGGSATGTSATTNASGVATVGSWKLGTVAGANTLNASSSGLTTVTLHATGTVDAPASLGINLGDSQSATVNTNVAIAPSVLVADQFGNPIPGVSVTFAVASGGGSATSTTANTNSSGIATVGSWKLGTTRGDNTLTADSGGLPAVTFHASGTVDAPAALTINSGDSQSATVNTNVPTAPSVHIADQYGNPVSGTSVTFAIATGGGSLTGGSATTNASGDAAVGSWRLGTATGANTLTADSSSLTTLTFHATGTVDAPASLAINAGDNQSATVHTNVATAPAARVTDQYGNPVSGVAVTFAVASGGGSATGTSATTNGSGVAAVGSWQLGTAAGANTLTAASIGLTTVTFHGTSTADSAAAIAANSGENQSATVNTNLPTAPSVKVTDQYGNAVSGISVTFAVASGGGSATGTSTTTDASGVATIGSWKLGTTAGANTLTATSGGLTGSPVTLTATGTADNAAAITVNSGDNQSATVDTNVATAPSVKVTDQYGNAVSGVGVTFAVGSGGGSATGLAQSTNASGVATVGGWKLGTVAGANTLNASSSGLTGSPVVFNAMGTAGNVDHLNLSPATTTITADQSQTYTVVGRDQFDNSLGDVTGATTLSVTGGTCLGAVCSAPATGTHTVTGSFLGAVGNATLNVSSGAPTHLAFTAGGTGNLALGATRGFTVAVEDAQNNVVTSDNSTSVTFARTAGPGDLTGLGAVTVSSGSASKTVTASLEGQVTLTASATGLTSAAQTFTVDPAPVATIDSAPADPSTSASATFDYSANDGAASFECRLDGAAYAACPGTGSGSKSYSGLASSGHTFDVRAKSASATGPAAHAAWMVDTTTPTVSLSAPADGSYVNTATKALAATATDTGTGVGAVDFEFSSTPGADCSTGSWTLINTDTTSPYDATWTTPADGAYALRAVAHDGATHASCSLVHVTVDQTAPTASLVSPAANVRGSITLHATGVADATSGLNSVSFERAPSGTSTWAFVGNGVAQGGGAFDAAFDTTTVTDATYDFRISVTDVAGNLTQQVVGPIRVDNTPPTSTIGAVAANVRQTITLGSTESDAGSGVASTSFQISPHGAATWTTVPASFDTTTKTDGDYDLRAVATDNVGNVGYSTPVTTKIDNTPPVATLDAIARYVRGSLTLGSSTSDAGSGLATTRYELSAHSANSWSTITSPFDTSTKADGDYDFRVVAIDNAGNRTDSAAQLVTIDNTAPSAQLDDPAASAIKRGTITLLSTVSDATSGIATLGYRVAPAGTPEATPCDTWGTAAAASFDTTTLADGLYDFRVNAIDRSGNGFCSPIHTSVRIDNTAPVTTDNAPAGPQNSDVTVTLFATDGGSGVTSTVYTVDGGPQQTGTSVVIPAAGNDGTHTIAYSSTDAAGNQEPTHTAQVHIDTTAPSGGAGNGGNAVRGNFVLTDSPTDTIASVEFQYRTGASGPWTSIGTDTDGSNGWHVTWDTTGVADGTYHLQMIETDDAHNPTTTPLADTVVDNTAPATASVNVTGCGAECSGTSVTLTGSADASVSGIGAMAFQVKGSGATGFTTVATQTSGFSLNWNSTTVPDGPTDIRIAVTDNAGNGPTYSPVTTVTVDNNAPTVTLTAPAALSGTVSLGAGGSADIASVTYAISPSGAGTWTTLGTAAAPSPFTFAWGSGARADGAYDLRVTATDGGGNQGSDVKTITIDNTSPTGALTQPAANTTVGGPSVALASTASDAGTGVASVIYQYRTAGAGPFTDIAGSTWDATSVASGDYDLRARLTDNAGNVAFTAVRTVTVDSTPPTLSLASLGTLLTGNLTIDAAVTGATQATLQVRAADGSWVTVGSASAAPFQITFDSSSIADGVYDVRVVAVDAFGNQASDMRTGVTFDNTAPQLTASTPEDGALLPNGSTISALSLTASEPLQSVTNVKVDGQPVLAAPVVTGATVNVPLDAPVADGLHTFTGLLTDAAGKSSAFRINATILAPPGSFTQPPVVAKNARPNAQTLLTSADGSTTVFVPANAYDVPFGHDDDFLVLSIGPQVASIAPMPGVTMAGSMVDITMDWNSSGDPVHLFRLPLTITMTDPTGGLAIPATFQNGAWRMIPLLAAPVLPAGQPDGFYRDAQGVHVLTTHLTLFTLVRDLQPPATPRAFSGVVAADGLTLRWAPGLDSNRIQKFLLYVDGQPYRYLGPTEFETKLGAFSADDTRSFSIAAINTSGISSIPTTPLQAVPTVTGRNVEDATATLAARGFTAGRLIPVASSEPAGTVVGPAGVQLLPAGSIVDLQVASASAARPSQFVLSIAVQKRLRVTNRGVTVRILATAPAKVSVTLDGVNYRRIQRWSFPVTAGASVRTLRLSQKLKPGTYTLYWLGRSSDGGAYRTSHKIRVITATAKAHTAVPAQIILTISDSTKVARRALQSAGQTIEATPEQAFAVASTRDASIVIVDADTYGVKLVRDLRLVFPTTAIVALSNSKVTLAILARQGAIAVPSSTPAAKLAALVGKLAKR